MYGGTRDYLEETPRINRKEGGINMTKKNLIIILVAAIVIIGSIAIFLSSTQPEESSKNSNSNPSNNNSNSNLVDSATGLTSDNTTSSQTNSNTNGQPQSSPFGQVTSTLEPNTITYSLFGYSPSTLEISKGTTVTFKNSAETSMWPASVIHPTHKEYPTTGGCVGSTFDACKEIAKGESWTFTFDKVGSWKYHDHLLPSRTGTITVK